MIGGMVPAACASRSRCTSCSLPPAGLSPRPRLMMRRSLSMMLLKSSGQDMCLVGGASSAGAAGGAASPARIPALLVPKMSCPVFSARFRSEIPRWAKASLPMFSSPRDAVLHDVAPQVDRVRATDGLRSHARVRKSAPGPWERGQGPGVETVGMRAGLAGEGRSAGACRVSRAYLGGHRGHDGVALVVVEEVKGLSAPHDAPVAWKHLHYYVL
mmetsp:Transcript_5415/g.18293  ORF Transcript_5415/g.18293 Transcript_5415/m.18293 type:complete len:214 (-) Transcript_5415:32-673(-)